MSGTITREGGTVRVTCSECGFVGSIAGWEVHSCYVEQMGGRCEDYPCCGHTDGDGCQTLPEHTSAYWYDKMARDDYDPYYDDSDY